MAKVFRLHEGQDGQSWFTSNPITKDQLKTIKTEGKDVATSIPSPFARIDLIKSAFQWVADNGINGNTAQHKLVSDTLDVAQLFFIFPKHKDKVKIVSWSPNDRFSYLSKDNNKRHSAFAETLNIFWKQDERVYNFDKVNRLYFLLNNANQIIGGTSPATLFMSAPDISLATQNMRITCGHDILFDNIYCPLSNRDNSFIEYFYTLSKSNGFSDLFSEVYSYLEAVKLELSPELQNKIANLSAKNIDNYKPCPVLGNSSNPCEVLNIRLGVQNENIDSIVTDSDFIIQPELNEADIKPMILPNDTFANQWVYTTKGTLWNAANLIPRKNIEDERNSKVPVQGDHYYWLSIDNFLEDILIELPYNIDKNKFITCGAQNHLLPLSNTFFKYFKSENVNKYLKLETLAGGGVQAILDIPVRRGSIRFKKTYNKSNTISLDFHLAIMPFVKSRSISLDYTIGLIDHRYEKINQILVSPHNSNEFLDCKNVVVRKAEDGNSFSSSYFKSKCFEYICIECDSKKGVIIPKMLLSQENTPVSFAVDFGTTNTHIEYKYGTNATKAIDCNSDKPVWQSLVDRKNNQIKPVANDKHFDDQLYPYEFNELVDYKFPFRTALTYNSNLNFAEPIGAFTHTNSFFLFEKIFAPRYLKLFTKLKWSNYNNLEEKKLVENFIDNLLYLVLYKTLAVDGNPYNAKITWFYPVSMDSYEQQIFTEVWQNAYKKIFQVNNIDNLKTIPESIAPYLHYRSAHPGLSLSIDVGGGSSDIAVFKNANNNPEFISSVRFAGNSIFGDGFQHSEFINNSDFNGFVKMYSGSIKNAIGSTGHLNAILNDILEYRKDSADFSSFLFSLENDNTINFNYTSLLRQDKKLKVVFFVFWGALIYYSASLIKKSNEKDIPKNILLSGTAAKTINILGSNVDKYKNISKFFTNIFQSVLETNCENINVILAENPKEISCKGALRSDGNIQPTDCPILFWIGGKDDSLCGSVINKKDQINGSPLFKDLDNINVKNGIADSINDFFKSLDNYVNGINLEGEFGIDDNAYKYFKETRSKYLIDYLEQGLKSISSSPDKHIEETLFFNPLIGILNKLSFEIV